MAGITAAQLADGGTRVALRTAQALWATLAERVGEPHLGLSALFGVQAESPTSWPDPIALCEHLFRTSDNLRDGVERLGRYVRLLRDGLILQAHDDGEVAGLRFTFAQGDPFPMIQVQLGMAMLLKRRTLPDVPCIDEVWFTHPAPHDVKPFRDFFQLPVVFDAPFDGLVSHGDWWEHPMPEANGITRARIEWRANTLLKSLPDLDLMVDRVAQAVRRSLPDGDLRVQAIARRLGMSARTLARRLHAEGQSYQQVLDEERAEQAKRDLAGGALSVREVAERVGFGNLSAFHRAFKAWTGCTPAEFRDRFAERDPDAAAG